MLKNSETQMCQYRFIVGFCMFWILLCASPAPVQADELTPWGVNLFATIARTETTPAVLTPAIVERLEKRTEEIASLERLGGPYSQDLTEPLLATASLAAEYGDGDRAIELYRWGLYTLRVNTGLNSPAQLPVIEQILALLKEQGDLGGFRERTDYLYRLMGRGAKPWTRERLAAADRWLKVRTELFLAWRFEGNEGDLLFLIQHAETLRDEVCADSEWASDFCAVLTLRLISLLYLVDHHVKPLVVDQYGMSQRTSYANAMAYNNDLNQTPQDQRLLSIKQSVRSRGRRLLDEARDVSPENSSVIKALADWSWFHGRSAEALALYRELDEGQEKNTPPSMASRMQPRPIPDGLFDPRDLSLITGEVESYDLQATINARGLLRNVILTPVDPLRTSLQVKAQRRLKTIRFSPVLNDAGEPTEAEYSMRLYVSE
jgi:hypothetical protein